MKNTLTTACLGLFLLISLSTLVSTQTDDDFSEAHYYNIAYATTAGGQLDEVVDLIAELDGIIITSADEWAMYQALFALDALWFDASAFDYLTDDVLQNFYRQGISLTAFNIEPTRMVAIFEADWLAERYTLTESDITFMSLQQLQLRPNANPIVPHDTILLPQGDAIAMGSNRAGILVREDERMGLLHGTLNDIRAVRQIKRTFLRDNMRG